MQSFIKMYFFKKIGCIPLKKIKLEASVTNEYWSNLKQLQIALRAVGCKKVGFVKIIS